MWWPLIDLLLSLDLGAIAAGALAAVVLMGPDKPPMPPDQHPAKTASIEHMDTFVDNGGAEYRVSSKITSNNR
jgi:hypothetical protein